MFYAHKKDEDGDIVGAYIHQNRGVMGLATLMDRRRFLNPNLLQFFLRPLLSYLAGTSANTNRFIESSQHILQTMFGTWSALGPHKARNSDLEQELHIIEHSLEENPFVIFITLDSYFNPTNMIARSAPTAEANYMRITEQLRMDIRVMKVLTTPGIKLGNVYVFVLYER